MSQITIVDDVLDFTEIAAAPAKRSYEDDQPADQPEYQDEDVPLETQREEEVQRAHALRSIRISGRLPR